jgi:hypothetical protein
MDVLGWWIKIVTAYQIFSELQEAMIDRFVSVQV